MTPEKQTLVKESFAKLLPNQDEVAHKFFTRLFELDPALRPMFQIGIKHQSRKFMDMLEATVQNLDQLDRMVPMLWQLGKRHGTYGVKDGHYEIVRQALVQTLERELGDAFTPETKSAWHEVYDLLATTMKQAAGDGAATRDFDER